MKRILLVLVTLILLLTISFSSLFSQTKKPLIAILDFTIGSNIDPAYKISLSLELANNLLKSGKYRILDRKNIDAILREQGFSLQNCSSDDCAVQIGKLLVVEKIVSGRISKLDSDVLISITITNVETGEIDSLETTSCRNYHDLFSCINELANKISFNSAANNPLKNIKGILKYNGNVIATYPQINPSIWIRNENTGSAMKVNINYDNISKGEFILNGLPSGKYGMGIDINTNQDNGPKYPGDLNAWKQFEVNDQTSELTIDMNRIIHLTKPADNNSLLDNTSSNCADFKTIPRPISFSWDLLDDVPGATYFITINIFECPYKFVENVKIETTTKSNIQIDLPPSKENQFYSFNIKSSSINGISVGSFIVHFPSGFGWDFRFRVTN
ncbi:MAG: CsgG/HfaB family protein [bacterium]|nr:CsgG/HfaB family protein [bacterium]